MDYFDISFSNILARTSSIQAMKPQVTDPLQVSRHIDSFLESCNEGTEKSCAVGILMFETILACLFKIEIVGF